MIEMARIQSRNPRKRNVHEPSCYLYGIDRKFEVMIIAVYVRGKAVRLSGRHGTHLVHPSNEKSLEGWKREAALMWNLTDIVDVPRVLLNSEIDKRKLKELKETADQRKQEMEGIPTKQI
jgi:hypothetical protein